jgi:AraC family transcriptional regulator
MRSHLDQGQFHGRTVARLDTAGLILCESAYSCGMHIPSHTHQAAFFYLVIEGTCIETSGGKVRDGGPSSLVFHPAGEAHANDWTTGGTCFHLEFSPSWLRHVHDHAAALEAPAEFRAGLPIHLAHRLHRELRRSDSVSTLAIEGLAL